MEFKLGETYKSYALWDIEKTGNVDLIEVVMQEKELVFRNQSDGKIYDLRFLGCDELVKCED